jgi:hypothetical protein
LLVGTAPIISRFAVNDIQTLVETFLQLTSTRHLLGRSGGRFLLFGMLTRSPEGSLCLEDLDGMVPLDISSTVSLQ